MSTSTSNTKQEYTYSLKSVAYADPDVGRNLCGSEMWFQVSPPDKYISLKRVRFHLIIIFDSGVSAPNQVLNQIGITDSAVTGLAGATYKKLVTLNAAADITRRLEVNIDLTSLLKQSTNNNHYIYLKFPQSYLTDLTNGGSIRLCKADALYTTTGIR